MSDLVKRLRNTLWAVLENQHVDTELCEEAAYEIERLRKRIDTLESREIDYEAQRYERTFGNPPPPRLKGY